jgi:hypothetical protein
MLLLLDRYGANGGDLARYGGNGFIPLSWQDSVMKVQDIEGGGWPVELVRLLYD